MIATDGSDCYRLAVNKRIELAQLSGGTVYVVLLCQWLPYLCIGITFSPMDIFRFTLWGDYYLIKIESNILR